MTSGHWPPLHVDAWMSVPPAAAFDQLTSRLHLSLALPGLMEIKRTSICFVFIFSKRSHFFCLFWALFWSSINNYLTIELNEWSQFSFKWIKSIFAEIQTLIESFWASIMAIKHSNIMLKNKILNLITCVVRSWPCLTFGGKRNPVAGFSVSGRVGTRPLTHHNIPWKDLVWPDATTQGQRQRFISFAIFFFHA